MAFKRPESCFLCEKKAKGELARPDSCKKHWFHLECLTEYGLRQNKCPIDLKEFKQVVCEDGRKVDICKRKDSSSDSDSDSGPGGAALLHHLAALSMLEALKNAGESSFKCELCNESSSGERATTSSCKHEFHRSCLVMHSRKENLCPKSGCRAEYQAVICQNGNILKIQTNPVQQMMSAIAAGGSFTCRLCHNEDATRERAKARPCGHEFHRGCLIERARRNNFCPICGIIIKEINCMFGPDLSVGSSSSGDNTCKQM